ncbi:MAG TPA: (2Fe-2S)-binding protein [Burkholderiales bacterium]|nr:(2Fe-2S)-binding protein [Burkholderiales bacterium]
MIAIEVNGERHSVAAEPETPLLYVLRNHLGLMGTRFGCGSGQCGACFVLVDGRAMASCDMPLSYAVDRKITTIEGLNGEHPVQKALERHQAAQCGYCMSGIVMSAVALLANEKSPSEERIRTALDKNLCRCGSHSRVVRAILDAR